MANFETVRLLALVAALLLPLGPAPSPFEMLPDLAFASLGAGKAVVPVGLCGLAMEGDGGGSALGAGVDVNKAVTRLVC